MVRAKGLEPSRRGTPDPKSGASANSATPAYCDILSQIYFIVKLYISFKRSIDAVRIKRKPKLNAENFAI